MMKKRSRRIPRLQLNDFARHIQGKQFAEQHLELHQGYNGYYADTLSNFQEGVAQLPVSYLQDFYNIYFLKEGKLVNLVQTQFVALQKETLHVTKPGEVKHWHTVEGLEGYLIAFSHDYLHGLKYRKNMLLEFPFLSPLEEVSFGLGAMDHVKISELASKIYSTFVRKDAYAYELIQLWTLEVLITLKKHYERNGANRKLLSKSKAVEVTQAFIEKLEEHFIEGFKINLVKSKGVNDFAKDLHQHPNQLKVYVKAVLGKTPKTVISGRYILAAKCKLIHTDMPVSEICYVLGYDNPPYFSAAFKKHTGLSPTEFRKRFEKRSEI